MILFLIVPINLAIDDAPNRLLNINQTILVFTTLAITYKVRAAAQSSTTSKSQYENWSRLHYRLLHLQAWALQLRTLHLQAWALQLLTLHLLHGLGAVTTYTPPTGLGTATMDTPPTGLGAVTTDTPPTGLGAATMDTPPTGLGAVTTYTPPTGLGAATTGAELLLDALQALKRMGGNE